MSKLIRKQLYANNATAIYLFEYKVKRLHNGIPVKGDVGEQEQENNFCFQHFLVVKWFNLILAFHRLVFAHWLITCMRNLKIFFTITMSN